MGHGAAGVGLKRNRGPEVQMELLDAWTVHDEQDQEVYGANTQTACEWWIEDKTKENA
jgi:hypothetical protein